VVTVLAGSGKPEAGNGGHANGAGITARFDSPAGIAIGPGGTLWVSDGSHRIRKITR